jgi:hypothetical protein
VFFDATLEMVVCSSSISVIALSVTIFRFSLRLFPVVLCPVFFSRYSLGLSYELYDEKSKIPIDGKWI